MNALPTYVSSRPIRRLLVANRGEIAARIMRTARQMGIETVAVYSAADRNGPYLAHAQQVVYIGDSTPAASYLRIEAIIDAARRTGADAVHPGYGFLSENAAFAKACAHAGLTFVGPSAWAIETMGDKAEAKRFMAGAGLPCVPGYEGESQDADELLRQAERIGYPVILKAKAGGGGRGMRVVTDASAFTPALASAKAEARNAFGDDRMMIERLVQKPRHIEIQVLVDTYGNGVHLGERDCSVQRRHQKLIEEAPAPGLSPHLRDQLGSAAVSAAVKLGYVGVGTFEFLLEGTERFYFMEMNTRLQVEHPVTEAITGEDLVAWQLRVAMGEPLTISQEDIVLTGHAIEARLCAEDEASGFLPQSGVIDFWRPAAGIRVEHAMSEQGEISPFYDSMFAKLIVHGRNRDEACRKMALALRETVAFGIPTNREALLRIMEHPAFLQGGVDTGFLLNHQDELGGKDAGRESTLTAVAAALFCDPFSPAAATRSILFLRDQAGHTGKAEVVFGGGTCRVTVDGIEVALAFRRIGEATSLVAIDGVEYPIRQHLSGSKAYLQLEGREARFEDVTYSPAPPGGTDGVDGRIFSMSNGQVATVMVAPGDVVEKGAPLLVTEAMKMMHTYVATVAGRIESVSVKVTDFVTAGRLLVTIEPEDAETAREEK